jgi:hypothetical protein
MENLFHPHLNDGELGDRHSHRVIADGLPGFEPRGLSIANDNGLCIEPVRYGFRSFDRQWIIPDNRLINRPNPELWESRSDHQIYLTALTRTSPSAGPAVTFTGFVPDLDHYKGSFGGRVYPLWRDSGASVSNLRPKLLPFLATKYGKAVAAEEIVAYIAAVAAHPGFTKRFHQDLSTPGLRIPITANAQVFDEVVSIGRRVLWLHTFGERMADPKDGRPSEPPRSPIDKRPLIPKAGAIPNDPTRMPDSIEYDAEKKRLTIGEGYVDNVAAEVWSYNVSGKQVLLQWFSYRKKDRERPIIGDRRPPSPLAELQPDHWLSEYTTELINLLNVLGLLVDLEPVQEKLLEKICAGPLLSSESLATGGALDLPAKSSKSKHPPAAGLFDEASAL